MSDIVERLRLIGLWRTPGGSTPKEKMPSTYKAVTEAADEIERLRAFIANPPKHSFWGAGEPDCPREIKAGNGELHTLRCKVCGQDSPRDAICRTSTPPLDPIAALLAPDEALVEAVARALARADGLDYDEPCGIQDGEGYCDSGTCVGAYLEDHDADYAREWYDRHARAALIAAGQELAKRKGEV